jgi:hypothetical protein
LLDGKIDAKRKFVITYFLSDDTILVTLVPELNSGMNISFFFVLLTQKMCQQQMPFR